MNWKTDKGGLQPSFYRVPLDLLPAGGLFVLLFHRIRSDPAPGYIDELRCLGVQSNITRGILSKCENWELVMCMTLWRA